MPQGLERDAQAQRSGILEDYLFPPSPCATRQGKPSGKPSLYYAIRADFIFIVQRNNAECDKGKFNKENRGKKNYRLRLPTFCLRNISKV